MLREALELLQKTAQQAAGMQSLGKTADGRLERFCLNGEWVESPVPPACVGHQVNTLDDLISFCKNYCEHDKSMTTPGVFHDVDQVVLVLDMDDRRDVVRFPLSWASTFHALMSLDRERKTFDQRGFVAFCVQTLGLDKAIVLPFRRLDWKTYAGYLGDVKHGADRLGKEITASVVGASELPEVIAVPTRVYSQFGESMELVVECHVDFLPAEQRIGLVPFVGRIDEAIHAAQCSIRKRLEDGLPEGVCVYYGSP